VGAFREDLESDYMIALNWMKCTSTGGPNASTAAMGKLLRKKGGGIKLPKGICLLSGNVNDLLYKHETQRTFSDGVLLAES